MLFGVSGLLLLLLYVLYKYPVTAILPNSKTLGGYPLRQNSHQKRHVKNNQGNFNLALSHISLPHIPQVADVFASG